jgi:DNA-binding NtrC family response regulator
MLEKIKVLYVDDNFVARKKFAEALSQEAFGTTFQLELAQDADDFLARLRAFRPHIVVLDIHLADDGRDGVSLLEKVKSTHPRTVAFMCSNLDDIQTIRSCLERGADDYIAKSYDTGTLPLRLRKAYQLANLQYEANAPRSDFTGVKPVGQTMQRLALRVEALVRSAVTAIHIKGESGTGKEVLATMIGTFESHKPFIRVNCGAISPNLLESELFGHVKGAFTGADRDKKGYLQAASGGWLFLDEVACLSSSAQVALLRVLENNEVLPLGSHQAQKLHIRIISAANEPLDDLVQAGRFRKDLWQRLMETEIILPPLRQRKDEIPELVHHFCQTMTGGPYRINPTALKLLQSYEWADGNIRELRNCLRAMTELHVDRELTLLSLPQRMLHRDPEPMTEVYLKIPIDPSDPCPYHFERLAEKLLGQCIRSIIQRTPRVSLRVLADQLAIPKTTLARRIKLLQHNEILDDIDQLAQHL